MAVAQDSDPVDCPRRLVIDKDDLRNVADAVQRSIRAGQGYAPLTLAQLEELIGVLICPLSAQTALPTQAKEHEQRVEQLTADQCKTLEILRFTAGWRSSTGPARARPGSPWSRRGG